MTAAFLQLVVSLREVWECVCMCVCVHVWRVGVGRGCWRMVLELSPLSHFLLVSWNQIQLHT